MYRTSKRFFVAAAATLALVGTASAQVGGGTRTGSGPGTGGLNSGSLNSSGIGSGSGLGGGGLGGSGLGGGGLGSGSGLGSGLGTGSGLGGGGLGGGGLGGTGGSGSGGNLGFGGGTGATSYGGGAGFGGGTFGGGTFGGGTFGGGATYGRGAGGNAASIDTSAARFAGIASSNLFSSTYAGPLGQGLPSTSGTGTATTVRFGSPLYTATVSSTNLSGTGTANTSSSSLSGLNSSTTSNMARPIMALAQPNRVPTAPAPNLQPRADLQQMVAASTYLTSKNIQISGQGGLVVLRGTAVSNYDRQLVEAMVRLKPGVSDVQNEITIAPAPAGTTSGTK